MSQEYNLSPYHNQKDPFGDVAVTPLMVEHLRATKPWVRLVSVIMFIFTGLMFLIGLAMFLIPTPKGINSPSFGLLGIVYIVMGAFYLVPAYFLHQYASYIRDFLQGGGDSAMESALGSQKSFWRFVGILTLVVICLYALIFIFAMLGAMSMLR
jgi:uncharacterized protein involved in cysteine biosynthesis